MSGLNVTLAQVNATVGDLAGNARKVIAALSASAQAGPDVVLLPEMVVSGYPAEDLLLRRDFLEDCWKTVEDIATKVWDGVAIVGFPHLVNGKVYNAASVLHRGAVVTTYHKMELPNYGVFDEERYFDSGSRPCPINIKGTRLLLTICEDIWVRDGYVARMAARIKPDVIVNISASPFHAGKFDQRRELLERLARESGAAVCYVNAVGGQDELIFDGGSLALDAGGTLLAAASRFKEDIVTTYVPVSGGPAGEGWSPVTVIRGQAEPGRASGSVALKRMKHVEEVYEALVLGTRDYVLKNGFNEVLIGLSGGVDSSLVAAIAVEALGADKVIGVTMPSEFTSDDTLGDAGRLAGNLEIQLLTIPIGRIYDCYVRELSGELGHRSEGVAFENIQARIRGNILMALSNHRGSLVLTTGNKSETAVGYCTLYGDLAGGFAVIKDVPKTLVYGLVKYINSKEDREIVPAGVISRPPSAELRPDQKDEDTLPPYDLLDRVLESYVEQDKSADEIADARMPIDIVRDAISRVDCSEYKRRQAPPGVKITPRAFGRDRRLPITNRYSRSRRVEVPA